MTKIEWSQCGKKNRYRTEKQASEYAKKCRRERGGYIDYYYCDICNGYHLTHQEYKTKYDRKYARRVSYSW